MRRLACASLLFALVPAATPVAAEPDVVAFSALGFVLAQNTNPGGTSTCPQAPVAISFVQVGADFVYEQKFGPDALGAVSGDLSDTILCAALPGFANVFSNRVPAVTNPCVGVGGTLQLQPDALTVEGSRFTISNHYVFCDGTTQDQTTVLHWTPLNVGMTQDFVSSDGFHWHVEGTLETVHLNPPP